MAIDVREEDFEKVVVEGSRVGPVVVDFWASWCAPCRSLGPILERVSEETGITLVKVDVDANPNISGAFGIRSIPTVYAFKDGALASSFVGALPEQQVREFFAGLEPSRADTLVAQAQSSPTEDAERLLREALEIDRSHRAAVLALARVLAGRDDAGEARELLARIPSDADVERLLAELDLRTGSATDIERLELRVSQDPDDLDAIVALARAEAAGGRHADALGRLLDAASKGSDEARHVMVDIFRVLGDENDLVREYRPKLASALF